MSIAVTIHTIANRVHRYVQSDEHEVHSLLETLRLSGQLFSHRTMIIGSPQGTVIFAPTTITRIEIETARDLRSFLPQLAETQLTLIPKGAGNPVPEISDTHLSSRIDCFFEGSDAVALWLAGPRPNSDSDRMMRITRLFEQPVITYRLPMGGAGFINPARITEVRIAAPPDKLPAGAWQLHAVD